MHDKSYLRLPHLEVGADDEYLKSAWVVLHHAENESKA